MTVRSQMRFVLPLERQTRSQPVTFASPKLVRALANLLLEGAHAGSPTTGLSLTRTGRKTRARGSPRRTCRRLVQIGPRVTSCRRAISATVAPD
jgi:hypothetical protein